MLWVCEYSRYFLIITSVNYSLLTKRASVNSESNLMKLPEGDENVMIKEQVF